MALLREVGSLSAEVFSWAEDRSLSQPSGSGQSGEGLKEPSGLEGFGQVQVKSLGLAPSSFINSTTLKQMLPFSFFHKGSLPLLTLPSYP